MAVERELLVRAVRDTFRFAWDKEKGEIATSDLGKPLYRCDMENPEVDCPHCRAKFWFSDSDVSVEAGPTESVATYACPSCCRIYATDATDATDAANDGLIRVVFELVDDLEPDVARELALKNCKHPKLRCDSWGVVTCAVCERQLKADCVSEELVLSIADLNNYIRNFGIKREDVPEAAREAYDAIVKMFVA